MYVFKNLRKRQKANKSSLFLFFIIALVILTTFHVQATGSFREVGSQLLDHLDRSVPWEVVPSHYSYNTPLIRIRQVVFDWDLQNILIGLDGVHGEIYILRLNQGETGLVMEEQMYVENGEIRLSMNYDFTQNLHYTLTLSDYFNHQHSVFTWRQPFDFEAERFVFTKDPIEVPVKQLPQTNDLLNNYIFYTVILCMVILIFIKQMAWRKRSVT